jgi:hypothetical protein
MASPHAAACRRRAPALEKLEAATSRGDRVEASMVAAHAGDLSQAPSSQLVAGEPAAAARCALATLRCAALPLHSGRAAAGHLRAGCPRLRTSFSLHGCRVAVADRLAGPPSTRCCPAQPGCMCYTRPARFCLNCLCSICCSFASQPIPTRTIWLPAHTKSACCSCRPCLVQTIHPSTPPPPLPLISALPPSHIHAPASLAALQVRCRAATSLWRRCAARKTRRARWPSSARAAAASSRTPRCSGWRVGGGGAAPAA